MIVDREYKLETKRCLLRHISEDDIPHVFSASRFEGFNDGMAWDPPATVEELFKPYRKACKAWSDGRAYAFTIESRDRVFIGRISIRSTDSDGLWDIGFWTHPERQGKGYMTEAVRSIFKFGFEKLSAIEIEACHASWNEASGKVLERCGMVWREHLPQGFKKRGEWVSEERLSILKEAYQDIA